MRSGMAQIGRCLVLLAALAALDTADSDPTMASYCDLVHMWTCEDFSMLLFWAIPKTGSRRLSQTFLSDAVPHPGRCNASVPRYVLLQGRCRQGHGCVARARHQSTRPHPRLDARHPHRYCTQPKYSNAITLSAEVHRWPLCDILGLPSPRQTYIAYPGHHPMTHMARHTSNHFVTMMRDPVDRVLSELFHCLYGKSFALFPHLTRAGRSGGPDVTPRGVLSDRRPRRNGPARIGPYRRLLASDVNWPKLLEQGNHPRLINSQLSFLSGKFLTNAPVVGVDETDLAAVTTLMEDGRLLVGVVEMFDESVRYFSSRFMLKDGWAAEARAAPRMMVTKTGLVLSDKNLDKPPSDQIPGSVVSNLTTANALDRELYGAAVRAIGQIAGAPARYRYR